VAKRVFSACRRLASPSSVYLIAVSVHDAAVASMPRSSRQGESVPVAQKTIVTFIDDLTGEEAEDITTVEFALEGVTYEIDLADDNAAKLRDNLARYVAAARKTSSARRASVRGADRSAGRGASNGGGVARSGYNRDTLKAIREWAKQNGHSVSDRGRLPLNVLNAWEANHQAAKNGKIPTFSG
jgi:Lsr2